MKGGINKMDTTTAVVIIIVVLVILFFAYTVINGGPKIAGNAVKSPNSYAGQQYGGGCGR